MALDPQIKASLSWLHVISTQISLQVSTVPWKRDTASHEILQLLKAIVLREIKDTGEIHPSTVVLTLIHSRYWWSYWQPAFSGVAPSLDAHSAQGFDSLVVVHVNAEPFDSECEQACCFLRMISINVFSLCVGFTAGRG